MNKNIIVIIIVIIIFLIMILEAILYHHAASLRTAKIELNNKVLKRQVAITEFTKTLKEGDYIDVLVHKNDFLLENELEGYKKWKK